MTTLVVIASCLLLPMLMSGADAKALGQRRPGAEDPDQGIIDAKGNVKRAAQNQDGSGDGGAYAAALQHIMTTCTQNLLKKLGPLDAQSKNASDAEQKRILISACGAADEFDRCIAGALKGCHNAAHITLAKELTLPFKKQYFEKCNTQDNAIDGNVDGDPCDGALEYMMSTCLGAFKKKFIPLVAQIKNASEAEQKRIVKLTCGLDSELDDCIAVRLRGCNDANVIRLSKIISPLKKGPLKCHRKDNAIGMYSNM